jgi:hypothetical protein
MYRPFSLGVGTSVVQKVDRGVIMARDAVIDRHLAVLKVVYRPHSFWAVSHASRLRKGSLVFVVGRVSGFDISLSQDRMRREMLGVLRISRGLFMVSRRKSSRGSKSRSSVTKSCAPVAVPVSQMQ